MGSIKVLIVPDKFKGSLSAFEAAKAIKKGWLKVRLQDEVEMLPMSDGGDGFGEAVSNLLGCKKQRVKALDAAGRYCEAVWWYNERQSVAIVESAKVIGIAMLPAGRYHPFDLDTYGLGVALKRIALRKPEKVLIGLGGSATNDGGFGMVRALGYKFIDCGGKEIERWTELIGLKKIVPPAGGLDLFREVIAAVDVKNLLLGKKGASRIYGPQKGLREAEIPFAERNLRQLARVVSQVLGKELWSVPGSGAAGGLGFSLMAFLNARVESGFEIFSQLACLEEKIKCADVVITGEGSFDRSSLMGKGTGEVARLCAKYGKPCIMLAGRANPANLAKKYFTVVLNMVDTCGEVHAVKEPSKSLTVLAEEAARFNF